MSAALSQLEREFTDMVKRIRRLEEIPVPSAAKLLRKTPAWVRDNLPIIYHTRKSYSVRLADIEAYQARRTVWPPRKEQEEHDRDLEWESRRDYEQTEEDHGQ